MDLGFTGRIALVTASSKGIGFGVAQALRRAGANICICARSQIALDRAAANLAQGNPARVLAMAGDVGDTAFLRRLVKETEARFGGPIDILVTNSGGPPPGEVLALTDAQWREAVDRNLLSVIRLSTLVVPGMRRKGWGRIINLASTTAKEPDPDLALSNVTRAGVAAYAKTLSREVGLFGITVNTILTGGCLTDRLRDLVARSVQGTGRTLDDALADAARSVPVGRLATPEVLGQVVLWLASDEAWYLTGVAIPFDGGAMHSAL